MENNDKFWLYNPKILISCYDLVPTSKMTFTEKINSTTRLIFLIFILMVIFNFPISIYFLVACLFSIIILYYINKRMKKENFTYQKSSVPLETPLDLKKLSRTENVILNNQPYKKIIIESSQNIPFCNDDVTIDPPSEFAISMNQNLTGNVPNPKTLINPVVFAPTHDLEYWRDNDLIVHSALNKKSLQQDMYLSGYAESTCCDIGDGITPPNYPIGEGMFPPNYPIGEGVTPPNYQLGEGMSPPNYPIGEESSFGIESPVENFQYGQIVAPRLTQEQIYIPTMDPNQKVTNLPYRENYSDYDSLDNRRGRIIAPRLTQEQIYIPTMDPNQKVTNLPYRENYSERDNNEYYKQDYMKIRENEPGWMNTSCGYNPEQLNVNLPSNMTVGNCQKDPRMKQYNKNLFTQIVTPGVYSRNEINEPINSNIGISFQQQFQPTTYEINENEVMYTQHDPRIIEEKVDIPYIKENVANYDNVYDPRFYGYGTSYRSYNEPITGQTRFIYDDINAIKMPNYITRSKIDHLPYADKYGPMQEGSEMGNIDTRNIRSMVQDSWLENSLQFRNELSERLMRKVNAQAWQRKQAPINTNQGFMRNRG
jgi:hypothetical protein